MNDQRNVYGGPLHPCSRNPLTGFFRDGCCRICEEDTGSHTVCAEMTADFLAFSQKEGNDLSTPVPEHGFPGLSPGDRWCLCASRWLEAYHAGVAPPLILNATNAAVLDLVPLPVMERFCTV